MPAGPPPSTPFARAFAWVGGAAFIASLAYTAYFYGVVLGRLHSSGDTHGPARAIGTNVLLFTVFALHHSVAARSSFKRWVTRRVPAELERSTYVWLSSILLALVCRVWDPVPGPALYWATGPWSWVGMAIQLAGLGLIARTVRMLDALELAGIRQLDDADRNMRILVEGPYLWVRHPLYLGWILAVFGTLHMTPDRLLFATISCAYLVVAIVWEERSLRHALGDQYESYMRLVPWKLVPFLY